MPGYRNHAGWSEGCPLHEDRLGPAPDLRSILPFTVVLTTGGGVSGHAAVGQGAGAMIEPKVTGCGDFPQSPQPVTGLTSGPTPAWNGFQPSLEGLLDNPVRV